MHSGPAYTHNEQKGNQRIDYYSYYINERPLWPLVSLSKNTGVVKGRQPLKLYSGSDDMCVRTDETPEVFVFCGFAARERMREAKPVKLKKVAFSHFFDILKARFLGL